jgi:Protein of unknown function (DUF1592)/Protein of unknown function (DUF1588)/Protein of unknown function (DUF1595)/Protein of unknown function (DUF1587)/Protein of unknown function (DUF1585)
MFRPMKSSRNGLVLGRSGLVLLLGVAACTGNLEGNTGSPAPMPGASGSSSSAGTAATDPTAPLDPQTGIPVSCDGSAKLAAPSPTLRLTNREYQNTLADLFPGLKVEPATLATDNKVNGFDTIASAQSVSSALVEGYFAQAKNLATAAVADIGSWLPCAVPATPAPSCGSDFVSSFAARAYRRPATPEELARLTTLFTASQTSWGFAKAVEVTLRAVLESPAFLYRIELGRTQAAEGNTLPLTGYEVASRLSYLLWDSMPDGSLLDAASTGALDSPEGVTTQARRLLADPRAHDAVATFQSQWLRFEKLSNLKKSAALFPGFSDATASALRDSAARYADYLFWQRGTLDALLTDSKAYVNSELAPIYGVTAPTTSELSLVDVNPAQRAGILTQAGLLAGFAHETADAPVLRGVFVLSRLLCDEPPPPPPGIAAAPEPKPGDAPMTTRDRLELTHVKPACNGCHDSIDGIGYGFSHYDALGAYRDLDSGLPVNASGVLKNTVDIDGPFDGAVELGKKLAGSAQVRVCVTKEWYRYALGLGETELDACALKSAVEGFKASGNQFSELLVGMVSSEAFRRRTVIAP